MSCFTALLGGTLQASAASAPRAWLVSKGSAQAVLVGESHFGTPTETDSYFRNVVQPSYTVADAAIMESYWGRAQIGNEAVDRGTPCPTEVKPSKRVRSAFDELIVATRANRMDIPDWLRDWEVFPDFLLTSIFLNTYVADVLGHTYDSAIESQVGLGISYRLRASAPGPAAKNIGGLESLKDQRAIFCSASAAHRQDYLADNVMQTAALLRLKQANPAYAKMDKLAVPMGRVVDEQVRCVDRMTPCALEKLSADRQILQAAGWMPPLNPGTFEIMIKQRTRSWIPLIEAAVMAHRRTFVIVGSMHLPDLSVGGKVQPGLISQLRDRGFTVKPIAGPDDIKTNFLSPSWSDRLRSLLGRL